MRGIVPIERLCRRAAVVAALALALAGLPAQAEAEAIKATTQSDRGSGRLILQWRQPVRYTVERAAPFVFVRFSRPFTADLDTPRNALARYLVELRSAGGGRVLVLRVAGQPRFVHYRRGNAVILTWIGLGRDPATAPPDNPTDSGVVVRPPALAAVPPLARPEGAPTPPVPTPPEQAAAPPPVPPDPTSPPKAEPPAAPPKAAAVPPPAPPDRPQAAEPPPQKAPVAPPIFSVTRDAAATRIAIMAPSGTAVSVFRYGAHVWIVLARPLALDLEPQRRQLGPGVSALARLEHAGATVLRLRARAEIGATVAHDGAEWSIVLAPRRAAGEAPELKLSLSRGAVERLSLPLPGAEGPISVVDPDIGSTLHIVASNAAAAIAASRRFVTFRILPAAQGAVIEDLADGLSVSADGDAVHIQRRGGLLLSIGPPAAGPAHGQ